MVCAVIDTSVLMSGLFSPRGNAALIALAVHQDGRAYRDLVGFEAMAMVRKGQVQGIGGGDIRA
ncbi:MAG TPA: hypothetical protein VH023_19985 [Rhodopila sp.]|nr:hypothetical protein [Rhodopila sp.]